MTTTRAAIEQEPELVSRLRQEARIHAQEARTANSTIAEIYQLCTGGTGEPGNWYGAEPVKKLIADHDAEKKALEDELGRAAEGAVPANLGDIVRRYSIQMGSGYRFSDTNLSQFVKAILATQPALPDAGLDSQRLKFLVEKADWHRKGTDGHWTIRLYNKRHTTFLQTVDAANATSKATS